MQDFNKWFTDRGDETHLLNYPLTNDSIVLELGGYKGKWSKQIYDLYKPKIIILEPVTLFYNEMIKHFEEYNKDFNKKIFFENSAITTEDQELNFYVSEDATSVFTTSNNKVTARAFTLPYYKIKYDLEKIDLIQMNIEGFEYDLLENWIDNSLLENVRFIHIQFHTFIPNCVPRRDRIVKKLKENNFINRFNYDFIWESWENLNFKKN
jgi:FkbM family methyltransferase